jgi:hypothetical protein
MLGGGQPAQPQQAFNEYGGQDYQEGSNVGSPSTDSEYGDMPAIAPMNTNIYGTGDYPSPGAVAPVDAPGAYGSVSKAMPKSVAPGAAPGPSPIAQGTYGSMSSISRMSRPPGASGGILPGSSLSGDLNVPGNRGTLASPMPSRPGAAPPASDNYGSMPVPGAKPPGAAAAKPPAAAATDNYGRMPMPSGGPMARPPMSVGGGGGGGGAASDNYGTMPTPVARTPGAQPPQSAAAANYGQMPAALRQQPPPVTGGYGNAAAAPGAYGNVAQVGSFLQQQPQQQQQRPPASAAANYGQMTAVMSNAPGAPQQQFGESDYGGLPESNEGMQYDQQAYMQTEYNGNPDEYGDLPPQEYGYN